MIQLFRWLFLTPACIAAWYLAAVIGLYAHRFVARFCPPMHVISGQCRADWFPTAEQIVMCFGVALSAFLVVLTAAAVAPNHHVLISKIAFVVGTVAAVVFAVGTQAYAALSAAVLAGAVGVWVVTRAVGRKA